MSRCKLIAYAVFAMCCVSVSGASHAQDYNSGDWVKLDLVRTSEFKDNIGSGTSSSSSTDASVEAHCTDPGGQGYVHADYNQDFVHSTSLHPDFGPATLDTFEYGEISGSASGSGWGYSYSDVCSLSGFCPTNYGAFDSESNTYSLDDSHTTISIGFSLLAKAVVPSGSMSSISTYRMICRPYKKHTANSADTYAYANISKG